MAAEAAVEVVAGVEVAIVVQVTVIHLAAQVIPRRATATTHHLDHRVTTMSHIQLSWDWPCHIGPLAITTVTHIMTMFMSLLITETVHPLQLRSTQLQS